MTMFTVHSEDTAPDASRLLLKDTRTAWGFIPKLHGILAESPLALSVYDHMFNAVATETTLSSAELQTVYIAVSVLHECEYCVMGHTWLARNAKLDESAIQALRTDAPISDARLEALRQFAQSVVRQRGFVGDAAVGAFIASGFTKAQVLEVVTIISVKTISNYINHLTHTPKEGFMNDPAFAWTAPRNRKVPA